MQLSGTVNSSDQESIQALAFWMTKDKSLNVSTSNSYVQVLDKSMITIHATFKVTQKTNPVNGLYQFLERNACYVLISAKDSSDSLQPMLLLRGLFYCFPIYYNSTLALRTCR